MKVNVKRARPGDPDGIDIFVWEGRARPTDDGISISVWED
jgi:hypothetical protein